MFDEYFNAPTINVSPVLVAIAPRAVDIAESPLSTLIDQDAPSTTSITDSQMHNNIMAAGSRDHPPMLATRIYAQWQSCFLRYTDTRPNGDALRKCILEEQSDWLEYTDEEIDKQELEAHYSFMAKIHEHSKQPESISNTCVVEKVDSNNILDSPDMYDNDIQTDQNDVECDDERVVLANLIANLRLDINENKKIQKQLKKANTSLAHELRKCKSILANTSRTLRESNSFRDSCLIALQNKQTELETYKTLNDRTVDYDKLEHKLNETLGLLAQKEIDIKEGLKLKAYEILVVKEKHNELVKQILLTKSHY
nr:hypothetical protein [Tanacetum cinerariifolium]